MKKTVFAVLALGWATGLFAETVEISVDLKFGNIDYVAGERIRAVVDVANSSPESVSVGYPSSKDMLFVEVFHSGSMVQLEKIGKGAFVSRFLRYFIIHLLLFHMIPFSSCKAEFVAL